MIPAHYTESRCRPHPRRIVFWRYKEIRSVRVGSSAGARELFTRALRETADGRLRVPILMAPMASACPASLAIAVANAGGLGCGALLMPPDAIHKWVSDVRGGTNGGFQLNLWMPDPPPKRDSAAVRRARAKADHHQDKEGAEHRKSSHVLWPLGRGFCEKQRSLDCFAAIEARYFFRRGEEAPASCNRT